MSDVQALLEARDEQIRSSAEAIYRQDVEAAHHAYREAVKRAYAATPQDTGSNSIPQSLAARNTPPISHQVKVAEKARNFALVRAVLKRDAAIEQGEDR